MRRVARPRGGPIRSQARDVYGRWVRPPIRLIGAAALLGWLIGSAAGMTMASNSGSNAGGYNTNPHICDATINSQCAANGFAHRVSLGSLPSGSVMRSAMLTAMGIIDDTMSPDLFDVVEWPTSSADVNATTGNFGNTGWWAYGACAANATYGGTDPLRWCSLQVITYNMTHPSNWDGSTTGRNTVACHELGHTIGLRHGIPDRASCMRNAVTSPAALHSHDDATIANIYD